LTGRKPGPVVRVNPLVAANSVASRKQTRCGLRYSRRQRSVGWFRRDSYHLSFGLSQALARERPQMWFAPECAPDESNSLRRTGGTVNSRQASRQPAARSARRRQRQISSRATGVALRLRRIAAAPHRRLAATLNLAQRRRSAPRSPTPPSDQRVDPIWLVLSPPPTAANCSSCAAPNPAGTWPSGVCGSGARCLAFAPSGPRTGRPDPPSDP
jgi:hypothetical protein